MTIESIYNIEKDNTDSIYLFKRGGFCKAYEKSAMLFSLNIRNYTVNKKHYKNINTDIVEMGFPIKVMETLKTDSRFLVSENSAGYTIKVDGGFEKGVEGFDEWKSIVRKQPDNYDDAFVKSLTVNPNYYTGGARQLFILCEDYNRLSVEIVSTMQRTCRYTHGSVIIENAYNMYKNAAEIVNSNNAEIYSACCKNIVELGNDNLTRMRLLNSLKYIDLKTHENMLFLFFSMKRVMEENIKIL